MSRPTFSLIVPTRGRPAQLARFLDSLAAATRRPSRVEVILVIDADDPASQGVNHPRLMIRRSIGPAGRTMGQLNQDGYAASAGDYVMLLNDDAIVRTRGWDAVVLKCFRRFPDPFVLVHVNDTLIEHHLCVFPLVSRAYCELAGGICPADYLRYRIDDHIEDPFDLLAAVGVRRTVYLPEVVFEHTNAAERAGDRGVYRADPEVLAKDVPLFDALFPQRKDLALRMLERIGEATPERRARLAALTDPFALRTAGRQLIGRADVWTRLRNRCRHTARRLASLTAGRG
ncbi:MAG: glycosyltransferase family 2 protein [Gemmataceae bacterium]|nr:glycosyltransferase family 2 protein [Gemmataceae bacterium]